MKNQRANIAVHRRVGVFIALVMAFMVVTGIFINHSHSLGWDVKPVYSKWIAKLYNIPIQKVDLGFSVQNHWVTQVSDYIYIGPKRIEKCNGKLVGARPYFEGVLILCSSRLVHLDYLGETIEVLPAPPEGSIGFVSGTRSLVLAFPNFNNVFDEKRGEWLEAEFSDGFELVSAQKLPQNLKRLLTSKATVPDLSWEKVILDIHSGRLFGNAGIYTVDFFALLMLILVFSGLFNWLVRINARFRFKGNS